MFNSAQEDKKSEQISQPELVNVQDRMIKFNSEYVSLLYEVEEKLHSVWNNRQSETDSSKKEARPMSNDFVGGIHEQLGYMEGYNNRLRKVLDHLIKIVG